MIKKSTISACSLADHSHVYVELPEAFDYSIELTPPPTEAANTGSVAFYDLKKLAELSLSATVKPRTAPVKVTEPPVVVQRYFTGFGQEFGGLAVHLFNQANHNVTVSYYELLPWYLIVYLHTFTLSINDVSYDPLKGKVPLKYPLLKFF